ncbi:4-diphosphocytidyl-2C-methyl-D-erythritol kinase [Solibacillus sp. FSL R7-0668]|uniref:4-diphosphocytidyl-2C-methyl-D-erythritol kinase n=1 Tax=Solibacillus sp. FSL R7-0668 TaxID=2921688 RepID=UPI0030F506E2
MCNVEGQPLLYIMSPSFILNTEIIQQEESTSLFIPTTMLKANNPLLEKQLSFFSKPMKEPRMLQFIMNDGERIYASIQKLQGEDVLLNCLHKERWIKVNQIVAIQHTL